MCSCEWQTAKMYAGELLSWSIKFVPTWQAYCLRFCLRTPSLPASVGGRARSAVSVSSRRGLPYWCWCVCVCVWVRVCVCACVRACVCVCVYPILLRVGLTVDTQLKAGLLSTGVVRWTMCLPLPQAKQNSKLIKTINIHNKIHIACDFCTCVCSVGHTWWLQRIHQFCTVLSTCIMAAS